MERVLDRFLRYVRVDTQADEHSTSVPSTLKQLDLCRMLADECRTLGLHDVQLSPAGVVTALVPANVPHTAPRIALVAHVDTSPECSGRNVQPVLHPDYDGRDIVLPRDPGKVIRVDANPMLRQLIGGTIVTTDGTTLLGADDKAGVAVIMSAAAFLMQNPQVPRGPVLLCFTCDEEIGRGVDHIDVPGLQAVCAYTLDGDGWGKIDCETFSADVATVTVDGINTHPSEGKGRMVNAVRILSEFIRRMPTAELAPEVTSGREGFLHPYAIEGGVASASVRIILRDFETPNLARHAALLKRIATELQAEEPRATIRVETRRQYRNLGDGLKREPRAVRKAEEALRRIGRTPELSIIRGGTDGSLLTERGLPTPNLSTGEHNPHSPLEWTSREELQCAVDAVVELVRGWSEERSPA